MNHSDTDAPWAKHVEPASTLSPDLLPPKGFKKAKSNLAAALYNMLVTYVPFHWVRLTFLRFAGMQISENACIMRGTIVMRPERISLGRGTIVGMRCFLGGESFLRIGNNVNISSFSILLGGKHDINKPTFDDMFAGIIIEDYTWIATAARICAGVRIGRGAVVATGAVVTRDVEPYHVVAGVPAKTINHRNPEACTYEQNYHPWLY